jgi:cytochrome c biogenesis protein CcmG/thiol:disulfide interchange protein DsbE
VPPLEVGEPAPGFALEGLDGGEVSLAALDGKVVVLNFWASWCGPCRLEMPDFQKAWEEHREQVVVFVGIAVDDTASEASKFAEQVGVTYPLALDTTGGVARAYRIRAVPSTYFIDREGRLATTLHGVANQGALRIFLRGQTSQEQ